MNHKLKAYDYYEDRDFRLFLLKYIYDVGQFIKLCEESSEWFNFDKKRNPIDFIIGAIKQYMEDNGLRPIDISFDRITKSPFDELFDFLKTPSPFDITTEPFKSLNEILNADMLEIVENVKKEKLDLSVAIKKLKDEIYIYYSDIS